MLHGAKLYKNSIPSEYFEMLLAILKKQIGRTRKQKKEKDKKKEPNQT